MTGTRRGVGAATVLVLVLMNACRSPEAPRPTSPPAPLTLRNTSAATPSAPSRAPEDLESLAGRMFDAFVGGDELALEDVFLTENEVRAYYNPAFVKILLPSWSTRNRDAWQYFQSELGGSDAVIASIEVEDPQTIVVEPGVRGLTLTRDATIVTHVRIEYRLAGETRTLVLKTCLLTERGWRAMQLMPGE